MKRILAGILSLLLLCSLGIPSAALSGSSGKIEVPYSSPELDGVISGGEWDAESSVVLNGSSACAWMGEVTGEVVYYFAWNDEGLFIAADITDDDLVLPEDDSQLYIKDAVQFALDPAGLIGKSGGSGGMFYSAAMKADGSLGACYHPYGGNAKQFAYEGAAAETDRGFSLEIMIPWERSIEILAGDGYAWEHAAGETIRFIVAMLDRDQNGAVANCYMSAGGRETVDFSPANYCYTMVLKGEEKEPEPTETSAPTESSAPAEEEEEPEGLPEGIVSLDDLTVDMYDPSGNKNPMHIPEGQQVGYRFCATAPFDALAVCCPSWGNNVGNLRMSLYSWQGSMEATTGKNAIATKLYENFADNAALSLNFPAQEAGQYLILLHDATETVGVWNFLTDVSNGQVYQNGQEADGEFQAAIHYTMTPEVNFGVCEDVVIPPAEPDETQPSEPVVTEPEETEPEETEPEETEPETDPVVVDMYDPNAAREALSVPAGQSAGYRFCANAPFNMLEVSCPSWSNNIGNLRFSLYRWNGGFEETVSGEVLATELFADYKDNAKLPFAFDTMEAGEYLLLLHEATESVGVWNYFSNVSGGLVYKNGQETNGEFMASISFCEETDGYFSECESVIQPPKQSSYVSKRDVRSDTWTATDGLGRTLPTREDTGSVREDKFVGLFYWTWHGEYASQYKPYNVTTILTKYPMAVSNPNHSAWGSYTTPHFWNEPLFGYYSTMDEWVLRKHAEMLADAGVDVIIFDNTNGTYTWQASYTRLMQVFAQARADGVHTPQIAFMLPFIPSEHSTIQLEQLYNDIYKQEKYQDLWFYWEGKPLIMAYPESLSTDKPLHHEIREFFTFRPGQPYYTEGQGRSDHWGWLSVYPQAVYYNEDGTPEQITVGVAQNHSAERGLTAMNSENVFGRTYTSKGYDTQENAVLYGANFAEQFEYALEVDPEFIFITGWNEWVAGRHQEWLGTPNAFPDQYNDTYSRDIEPSKGQLKDHYYYQMVSFIRRFKGTDAVQTASQEKTIQVNQSAQQWSDVAPVYYAYKNNIKDRNAAGYQTTHYVNTTGRNDISLAKVARDDENVYFYVECENQITQPYAIASDAPVQMELYDPAGAKEAVPIPAGQHVGYRFYATAPFEAMTVCCPSWNNNIGNMRFSLYRWDESFDKTVSSGALATKLYQNYKDNENILFNFEEQKAGEYLLLLHDTSETVGVWNYLTDISGGIVYKNGAKSSGEFQAAIHYTKTPQLASGDCSDGEVSANNPLWMRLLIDIDGTNDNWEGYEYILNRETPGVLERSEGGWNWEAVGAVDWSLQGNVLQVKIPRSYLNLDDGDFTLRYKWADNNLAETASGVDILDFYQYGDTAPGGRFQFCYKTS